MFQTKVVWLQRDYKIVDKDLILDSCLKVTCGHRQFLKWIRSRLKIMIDYSWNKIVDIFLVLGESQHNYCAADRLSK